MHRLATAVLLFLTAFPVVARNAQESSGRQRTVRVATVDEAEQRYDALSRLSLPDRKLAYLELNQQQQSGLWAVQLRRYLKDHPELTREQRAVFYQALGMIADGVLDRTHSTDRAISDQALADIALPESNARLVLEFTILKTVFTELGPSLDAITTAANRRSSEFGANMGGGKGNCECTYGDSYCWFNECSYTQTCTWVCCSCGWMWQYTCNGLCL